MSEKVQYKLSQFELEPPSGVWQKIALELDDAASGYQFPSRLNELAVDPPVAAWANILAGLDLAVPAGIPSKLLSAEVVPPAAAWDKISEALNEQHSTKTGRRIPAFVRYAAAAVVIGLMAWGGLQLLNTGGKDSTTASVQLPVETGLPVARTSDPSDKDNLTTSADESSNDDEARNDAALEASKKTYARLDISRKKDAAAGFDFAALTDVDMDAHLNEGYEEGLLQASMTDNSNRYILLMTPDGHFIRMSKKLSDLVCCVSGEEEDIKCRTQVDKWRKQIACSPTPHPGNFMDILSLLGSLQDK